MAQVQPTNIPPLAPPGDQRIHLRILSPGTGVHETVELRDVPLSTTILALKQRINHVSPSHPPLPSQRLIFAGRVLADDAATLPAALGAEAIRNSDLLTIHLIMRAGAAADAPSQSQPISRARTPSRPPPTATATGARMSREPSNRSQEGRTVVNAPIPETEQVPQGPQLANPIPQAPGIAYAGFPPVAPVQPMFQMAQQMADVMAQQMAHQAAHNNIPQGANVSPATSQDAQAAQQGVNNGAQPQQDQRPSDQAQQAQEPAWVQQHAALHREFVRRAAAQAQQHRAEGQPFAPGGQAQNHPPMTAMPFPAFPPLRAFAQTRPQPQLPPSTILSQSLAHLRAYEQVALAPETMYLLSSPQGPQAILHHNSERYLAQFPGQSTGFSTSRNASHAPNQRVRGPGLAGRDARPEAANQQVVPGAPIDANNVGAAPAQEPHWLQPLLNPLWLLVRILTFAYFFYGHDHGWGRRPWILIAITVAFILLRGLYARPNVRNAVRSWWNGIVGLPPHRAEQQNNAQQQQQPLQNGAQNPQDGQPERASPATAARAGNRPGSPARNPQAAPGEDMSALRRRLRPIEQAAALFVASMWPGVGENTIRQRREAEAARQREEAEALASNATQQPGEEAASRGVSGDGESAARSDGQASSIATTEGTSSEGVRERQTFTTAGLE